MAKLNEGTKERMKILAAFLLEKLNKKLGSRPCRWLAVAAAACAAYCNSFGVPFLLDDFGSISNNYAIHRLFNFSELWKFYANRIVLYFTLSINYAVHGTAVEGYHIVNLIIHVLNCVLFLEILRKLLSLPYFKGKQISRFADVVSTAAAMLYACHPIQVNAVTYIIQRTASLASAFYMAALLFYLDYRMRAKPRYLAAAFACTVLAMFTKENTITIPFMLLVVECLFSPGDKKISRLKRIAGLLPIFATIPIIPATNLLLKGYSQSDPNVTFKASTSMDRLHYFYTQLNVIMHYIRLLLVPVGQNFDYGNDYPVSVSIWDNRSYISFAFLLIIGLFAVLSIRRNRLATLGVAWFFIGLSVESSFISIKDVYFEHRLYFPSAGFLIFLLGIASFGELCLSAHVKKKRCKELGGGTAVSADAGAGLVTDTGAGKKPDPGIGKDTCTVSGIGKCAGLNICAGSDAGSNPVVCDHTGNCAHQGNRACLTGIAVIFRNPAMVFVILAIMLFPVYTCLTIYRNYIYSDSIRLWSDVVSKAPGSDRAHNSLATAYLNAYDEKKKNTEYLDMAEIEFKKALEINSRNSTAHTNLSKVYLLRGDYTGCINEARRALELARSEYAQFNLGSAYKKLGKTDEALDAFLKGYEYNSHSSFILKALGDSYYESADYKNAEKFYKEYLENTRVPKNGEVGKRLDEIRKKLAGQERQKSGE